MKMKPVLALAFLMLCLALTAQVEVTGLLTENMTEPVGIDAARPRFSWQLLSDKRNTLQTAYELRVSEGTKTVWNSGIVNSDQSVHVLYAGEPLRSGRDYNWQVRVWINGGKRSAWSPMAKFRTGMLDGSGWKAKWIEPGYAEDSVMRPSPMMRKEFTVKGKIIRATAYITAHGIYEAELNGKRIGDAFLTPGWTSYGKRLQYQAYDVTPMLRSGRNAVGVTLGSGWYRGNIGFRNSVNFYGSDIALLCQIDIAFADGSTETIISDGSWKSSTGAIRYSEIYHGEIRDARLEKQGWTLPGYDDTGWDGVKVTMHDMDILIATQNEPVKKHETFNPVRIMQTPAGDQVIDFGQNLVGWVRMRVQGNAGDSVILSHAEVLDRDGNFIPPTCDRPGPGIYMSCEAAGRSSSNPVLHGTDSGT